MNKKINKREKLIEKIRQSREEYTSLLNESNEFLESYKNKNENILQTLEGKYQSLISNIYSTLITTVDNRIDLINKINLLYSSYLEKNLKNITVKKEIMEFIIKNATKDFPLNKFEFISNNFENNNKLSSIHINNYLKEKLENEENFNRDSKRPKSQKKTEAKNFNGRPTKKKNTNGQNENASIVLENPLNNDIKNYKIKSNIYLIENFIEELIFDQKEEKTKDIELISCSDSSGKMKEISNIKSLLDKKNDYHIDYLENFFKALNLKRAKGHFVLDKKSYDILIDLFNFLLNNQPNVDFILKNIIILSQTFYSLETNKDELNLSKKKIFLQNGLKNLPIFNNPETWHRVINFNLSSNINSKDISLQLDKNEINKKLSVLAYNLLMSYLTDIKDFTNDQNVFEEVKNFYIRIYNLNAETLNKQINDIILYEPEPKKKKVYHLLSKNKVQINKDIYTNE